MVFFVLVDIELASHLVGEYQINNYIYDTEMEGGHVGLSVILVMESTFTERICTDFLTMNTYGGKL